jgi:peptidase M28-like protein
MRIHTVFTLAPLLLCGAAFAQSAARPTFTAERVRAHVAFLADDRLEGRDTGSRGYDIAAKYVSDQFASFGLKPAGDNGTWYQQVTFQRTEQAAGKGSVTISGPAGETRFAHATDVFVGLSPNDPKIDVSAPLVFVGYGLEDKRFHLDDYRGLDVKGKIVVTLSGYPKGLPSEEGAHLSSSRAKFAEAHGAIGMLGIQTRQSEKTFPWARQLQYANDPDFNWVGPDGRVHQNAPGIRVGAVLHGAAAKAVFSPGDRDLDSILAEADKPGGKPKGFALKTSVRIENESHGERVSSPNVIGVLPGSDPTLKAEYVILSAHLDHLGIKPLVPGGDPKADRINNGALDNAAGVATMLEVARVAAAAPDKPRRSILFLASTAEEKGLLGADYYARHPTVPIRQIVGDVDLDMPVLLYPFTDVIAFGANHSSFGKLVAKAVAPMNLELSPDPMPEQGVFTRSDHYMFVKQGVPAVFLVTGFANGGEKAWHEFLNGPYHSPQDDLTQKIDWDSGARFAEANYRVTRAMADGERPLWIKDDYFGDIFAPDAPRASK